MQAEFEMKIQVIRSKGRVARLFVNLPLPLAAALDFQAGEPVRWQLLNRSHLAFHSDCIFALSLAFSYIVAKAQ